MINKARWRNIDGTIDASILPCDYRCLSTYIQYSTKSYSIRFLEILILFLKHCDICDLAPLKQVNELFLRLTVLSRDSNQIYASNQTAIDWRVKNMSIQYIDCQQMSAFTHIFETLNICVILYLKCRKLVVVKHLSACFIQQ